MEYQGMHMSKGMKNIESTNNTFSMEHKLKLEKQVAGI